MNTIHTLFDQYQEGILDDSRVEELHAGLMALYFTEPAALSRDEAEYTEDLLIEAWLNPDSDAELRHCMDEKIRKDEVLRQKAERYSRLKEAFRQNSELRMNVLVEAGTEEENEEEQLRKVLGEVFSRIEAEQESEPVESRKQNSLKDFLERITQWIENQIIPQNRLRLALVMTSVMLLAFVVWIVMDQKPESPLVTANPNEHQQDTITRQTPLPGRDLTPDGGTESQTQPAETALLASALSDDQRRKSTELFAQLEQPCLRFEFAIARSATDPQRDSLIAAAKLFNTQNYLPSIDILKALLKNKAFDDDDTLSRIHLYMGAGYFYSKGMRLALQSLKNVSPESDYYKDAVFYMLFAHLALGEKQKSDALLQQIGKLNDAENLQAIAKSVREILSE